MFWFRGSGFMSLLCWLGVPRPYFNFSFAYDGFRRWITFSVNDFTRAYLLTKHIHLLYLSAFALRYEGMNILVARII